MIRVRNLVKTFGSFTAVNDVSFDVEEGEIFAFLGPNGAGKTTTIKMLTTLLKPTSGAIELDGLDPQVRQNEARKRFGIVFQDPSLDGDLTAWENMEIHGVLYHVPHKIRRQRSEELLKLFELWERRDDQVKKFSGGMKRRLEIARGFLHTPRILFLDEPTLGLDPQSRNQLWTHREESERGRAGDRVSHHALHGRSRPRRPSHRRHRPRQAGGTGHAARDQGPDRNRDSRRRIPQADRLDHSRRERRPGRHDAAIRQDVERRQTMSAIYILWLREVKRYIRSRAQIIASLGQPMLYLLVLGFGLGPVFKRAGNGNYLQFVAPGVIGMTVLFSSIFSGLGLLWDRQFGFLKETLVAPVPRLQIMIGRTLGGATVAIMQGLLVTIICVIAGFRPAHISTIPVAIGFMILIALLFAALGVAIGSSLQDMQGFQLIMNFLVMPIYFLSGAMFPLNDAHNILRWITRADPLSYGIDGLRNVFGSPNVAFDPRLDALVLAVVGSILLVIGAHRFSKIEI